MSKPNNHTKQFNEESLTIVGYQGEHVSNSFFRQSGPTKHLAIILPGAGYNARMPLLYYTVNLFLDHQADILTVDYEYRSQAARNEANFEERLTQNITAAIQTAISQRSYEQVTLIGKSIGTRGMSWLLAKKEHPLMHISKLRTVWLTPVWSDPKIFGFMKSYAGMALHIIGTGDQAYYRTDLECQLKQLKNTSVLTIEDADHSLDIDGDIGGSLNAIKTAVRGVEAFVFGSTSNQLV